MLPRHISYAIVNICQGLFKLSYTCGADTLLQTNGRWAVFLAFTPKGIVHETII